jgi:hypothetical protein
MSNEELGVFILSEFGLDKDEIEVRENSIFGNPTVLTITKMITGIRFAVYDIELVNDKINKSLSFKVRLYKLFIIPLLFPIFSLIVSNDIFLPGMIGYIASVIFGGLIATIELYLDKSKIERKIKGYNE